MTTDTPSAAARRVEDKLLAYCRAEALLAPGDTVIAACSGGADSMAMLLFLLRRQAELGIRLLAAHVDHGIRGAASRADAAFVRDFCRRSGVELLLYDAVAEGVQVPKAPSEDWARRLRYAWFDALAARYGAKVATAHTMNDQAETLLFRLARGTGVHGMGGIAPRRGAYVRPCLCLTRAETEAYCAALGQRYVVDATNTDPHYARNRLRRQALPVLCGVNPNAVPAMAHFAKEMRELDAYITAQAESLLAQAAAGPGRYSLHTLRAAPAPVRRAALYALLRRCAAPARSQVEALCALVERGRGAVQAAPQAVFCCGGGYLHCAAPEKEPAPSPLPPQPARPGHYTLPGGYELELCVIPAEKYEKFIKNAPKSKKHLNCCADYDKIGRYLWLRTRQPGDRYAPPGRGGHKTLKKYLNEQAIPTAQRALLPLLALGGEVVWAWGGGFAEACAPNAATRTVLAVRCLRGPGTGREGEDTDGSDV